MKDYVSSAIETYYGRSGKTEDTMALYQDAIDRFHHIHVLNGIAYTESLKAIDMIDDMGRRRFLVKKYLGNFERRYEEYEHYLNVSMEHSARTLMHDYTRVCHTNVEDSVTALRDACVNYLNENGKRDAELLAQAEASLMMWQIAVDTFDVFFESYRKLSGVDFSKDFSYANMSYCRDQWLMLVDELSRGIGNIDFGNDKACVDCWNNLKDTMDNEEFFDKSALQAMKYNDAIYQKYIADKEKAATKQ